MDTELRVTASIPRRAGAYLLDVAPFGFAWVVVLGVTSSPTSLGRGIGLLAWFVLFVGYLTVAIARFGRTIGMAIVGIRVVAVRDGRNPSLRRSFARALLQCVARPTPRLVISLPLALIVYGPVFFVRDNRGAHDLVANTVVVENGTIARV